MPGQRDYYEILGVVHDATEDEIRKAYRKLAHKYHPDKTGGDKKAEDKLKEINAAYNTLRNPEKRSKYDQFGEAGDQFGGAGGFGGPGGFGGNASGFGGAFEDIFDAFFNQGTGTRRRSNVVHGNDLEYRVRITLKQAAFGAKKKISFKRKENCSECNGSGAAPGSSPEICRDCGGNGEVRLTQGFFSVTRTCPHCRGAGRVITSPCKRCSGSGVVDTKRDLSLDIPPGVDTGARLRVGGEGEPGRGGGARGDLYILIEVELDEMFTREGNSIICEVPISFIEASMGKTIRVPTLKGEADLKIPAGTQSGTLFKLRSLGIPDLRGYSQGDQIIKIQVETPTKLNKEQKELLKRFEELSDTKTYPLHKRFMDKLKESFGG